MSEIKRSLMNLSFYDQKGIEDKLEKMAARGWMLEKPGTVFWTYRKIPPQSLRFAVTYFPSATQFDPGPSEAQLTKEEFCAWDGWRLVARWDAMQIFCTAQEDPVPIETDPVTQVENIRRTMKKRASLPILTKPAHVRNLGETCRRLFALECRCTDLYGLLLPSPIPGGLEWTSSPVLLP